MCYFLIVVHFQFVIHFFMQSFSTRNSFLWGPFQFLFIYAIFFLIRSSFLLVIFQFVISFHLFSLFLLKLWLFHQFRSFFWWGLFQFAIPFFMRSVFIHIYVRRHIHLSNLTHLPSYLPYTRCEEGISAKTRLSSNDQIVHESLPLKAKFEVCKRK